MTHVLYLETRLIMMDWTHLMKPLPLKGAVGDSGERPFVLSYLSALERDAAVNRLSRDSPASPENILTIFCLNILPCRSTKLKRCSIVLEDCIYCGILQYLSGLFLTDSSQPAEGVNESSNISWTANFRLYLWGIRLCVRSTTISWSR